MHISETKGNASLFEIAVFFTLTKKKRVLRWGVGRAEQTVTQQNLFSNQKVKQKASRAKLNTAEGGC